MRATAMAVFLLMHHSAFWRYRFWPALLSQAMAVVGLVILSLAQGVVGLALGLVALGLLSGHNYFASLYYSSDGHSDDRRGLAGGIHEGTLGLGLCAGSFVGGVVGTYAGVRAPYVLGACVVGAMAVVQAAMYVRYVRPLRKAAMAGEPGQSG